MIQTTEKNTDSFFLPVASSGNFNAARERLEVTKRWNGVLSWPINNRFPLVYLYNDSRVLDFLVTNLSWRHIFLLKRLKPLFHVWPLNTQWHEWFFRRAFYQFFSKLFLVVTLLHPAWTYSRTTHWRACQSPWHINEQTKTMWSCLQSQNSFRIAHVIPPNTTV